MSDTNENEYQIENINEKANDEILDNKVSFKSNENKRKLNKQLKNNTIKPGISLQYNPCDFNEASDSLKIPLARVKRIIKEDPEFHSASSDAYSMIAKAAELFVQLFAIDSYNIAIRNKRSTVTYKDFAAAVVNEERYEFLSDVVPKPMSINKAQEEEKRITDQSTFLK